MQSDCLQHQLDREHDDILCHAEHVLGIEIAALEGLRHKLDGAFVKAVSLLEQCRGRVIVTGMGKSGLVGRKIAATLSSTGTPALFLHPAEGVHGDLGMVTPTDVVIAISNSGETMEILQLLPTLQHIDPILIAITGNPNSYLAHHSDVVLCVGVEQEACPLGLAPTASTTATLVMGDMIAMVLLRRKGFTPGKFALFHPAGCLGQQLHQTGMSQRC